MKRSARIALAAGLLLAGCGGNSDQTATPTNGASSASSPLSAPADYLGALGKGQQSAVKTIDTASLNQAIQLYNVDHGGFPKDLNELVQQKYLPHLPDAPRGMRIDYDPATGVVKLVKE